MKCLSYIAASNNSCCNQCQYGYKNCANFKPNVFDFNKCRNYDLRPNEEEILEFAQYLDNIGVLYKNDDGTFKSMYEVFENIAKIYKEK